MEQHIAITDGVLVRVEAEFKPEYSDLSIARHTFVYHVTIENRNEFTIQLMHRDWFIFDSLNSSMHVSGEGVVGQQPEISPGEVYSYSSSCELISEIGSMHGFYSFVNKITGTYFRVDIPSFLLSFPGKWN